MIQLKAGVRARGLRPELLLAITVAETVYRDLAGVHLVITSLNDGRHRRGSLHYSGQAVDLRVHHLASDDQRREVASALATALGEDYDVLLESLGTSSAHIHVEYQPSTA